MRKQYLKKTFQKKDFRWWRMIDVFGVFRRRGRLRLERVVFPYWFRPVCGIRVNRLPAKTHRYRDLIDFFFFHAVRKHKRIPFERFRFRRSAAALGFIVDSSLKDEAKWREETRDRRHLIREMCSTAVSRSPKIRRDSPYFASSSTLPFCRFFESWALNFNEHFGQSLHRE